MTQDFTFTRRDVVSQGFEARCVGVDGARYLWHGDCGLRVDSRCGTTTLLHDPIALPHGPWFPTVLGLKELRADASPTDASTNFA